MYLLKVFCMFRVTENFCVETNDVNRTRIAYKHNVDLESSRKHHQRYIVLIRQDMESEMFSMY